MEQTSSQTIATFTGTLLRREHMLGQKFVQLVFRENNQNVLCVSTDPKNAALLVGQNYHVEGALKEKSGHSFIQDPRITQLKKHWSLIKRVVVSIIIMGGVAGLGGTAFALHDHSTPSVGPQQTPPAAKPATQTVTTVPASTPVTQPAPTTPAPATHAIVTAVKKPTPKPAAPVQAAPVVTPVSNNVSVQQPLLPADPGTPASSDPTNGGTGTTAPTLPVGDAGTTPTQP